MNVQCKGCQSGDFLRNGRVRGQKRYQRYQRKQTQASGAGSILSMQTSLPYK